MKQAWKLAFCCGLVCCAFSSPAKGQVALRELAEKIRLNPVGTVKATRDSTAGRVYNPAQPTIDHTYDDAFDFPPSPIRFQTYFDQSTTADNGTHTGSWTFHTSVQITGNPAAGTAVELGVDNITQLVDLAGLRINLVPVNLPGALPPVSIDFLDLQGVLISHRELRADAGPVSFDFPSAGPVTMLLDWNWSSGVLPAGNYAFDSSPLSLSWNISSIPEPTCAVVIFAAMAQIVSRKKRSSGQYNS